MNRRIIILISREKNTACGYIHYFSNQSASHHADIIVFKKHSSALAQGLTGNETGHLGFQQESFGRFVHNSEGSLPTPVPK